MPKKLSQLTLLILGLFVVYTLVGVFARTTLLDTSKPFPSWTYTSPYTFVNAWTSWDSGFYYDIAEKGYPKLDQKITVANIDIPADGWVKVFLGSGLVGEKKFALPHTLFTQKVNNTLFLIGKRGERVTVPIYNGYEGIGYCEFTGPIDYDRDVKIANEGITNPTACGDSACDTAFVTYYSAYDNNVVYQESFSKISPEQPQPTFGSTRPNGMPDLEYRGDGCRVISKDNLVEVPQISYEKQFTVYAFMPLYSNLAKFVSLSSLDVVVSGILISLVCFIVSAFYLYKLLQVYFDESLAWKSTILYILFPFSFFNFAFLSVSIFNMLLFMTLFYAKKSSVLSGFLLSLLVYTNIYGLLVLIPLYFMLKDKREKYLLIVSIVLLTLFMYLYALYSQTGDWLVIYNARKPWYGDGTSFVGGLFNYFVHFDKYALFETLSAILLAGLSFFGITRLKDKLNQDTQNMFYALLSCFLTIGLVNGGLSGVLKYSFFGLSLFVYLAMLLESKKLPTKLFYVLFVLLGALFMAFWSLSSRFII